MFVPISWSLITYLLMLNGAVLLMQAGGPGLVVEPPKIVWTPYNAERDYANYKG